MFCEVDGPSVCSKCEHLTGVREMTPPRRRLAPCPRCNHPKLIRVVPRELRLDPTLLQGLIPAHHAIYGLMFATYDVKRHTAKRLLIPDEGGLVLQQGIGVYEAYICKRCGFVDWYCQDPENIPIGPEYMTEDVDSDATAPYR